MINVHDLCPNSNDNANNNLCFMKTQIVFDVCIIYVLKKNLPLKLVMLAFLCLINHSTQKNSFQKIQCMLTLNIRLNILWRAFDDSSIQSGKEYNKQKLAIPEQDTQRLDEILEIIILVDNLPFIKCNLAE